MRTLLAVLLLAAFGLAPAADPPAKKPDPPAHAILTFGNSPKSWDMTLEMTTASGASYELPIDLSYGNAFREMTQGQLIRVNWMAELSGDLSIRIYGVRTKSGKADAVKSLRVTTRVRQGLGQTPKVTATDGVKVEAREDDGKAKPAAEKRPSRGPDLGAEPFVEFDFSVLPPPPGIKGKFTWRIDTEDDRRFFKDTVGGDLCYHDDFCLGLEMSLNEIGFKAEVVGKSRLRVYGNVREDRFYPATKGSIESPDLKKEQLPKVTNPRRDF